MIQYIPWSSATIEVLYTKAGNFIQMKRIFVKGTISTVYSTYLCSKWTTQPL